MSDPGADTNLLSQWLAHGLEGPGADVFEILGALRARTGYPREALCHQIQCDPAGHPDSSREQLERAVEHSRRFLTWTLERVELAGSSTKQHCRDVVRGAALLTSGAPAATPEERLELARRAFDGPPNTTFPPSSYLILGEVQSAWQVAALNLGSGVAYREAHRVAKLLSPLNQTRPHIHPSRMRLLLEADSSALLGIDVRDAMSAHLRVDCDACDQAFAAVMAEAESADRVRRALGAAA